MPINQSINQYFGKVQVMNRFDVLTEALVELIAALADAGQAGKTGTPLASPERQLLIVGGFGLHLLQSDRARPGSTAGSTPLLEPSRWYRSDSTKDIDIGLSQDAAYTDEFVKVLRKTMKQIGYQQSEHGTRYLRLLTQQEFEQEVVLEFQIRPKHVDVTPKQEHNGPPREHVGPKKWRLRVYQIPEALALETNAIEVGLTDSIKVRVAHGFTYTVMKAIAFEDRRTRDDERERTKHAVDLYRIAAMSDAKTRAEIVALVERFHGDPHRVRAAKVLRLHFCDVDGRGWLDIERALRERLVPIRLEPIERERCMDFWRLFEYAV